MQTKSTNIQFVAHLIATNIHLRLLPQMAQCDGMASSDPYLTRKTFHLTLKEILTLSAQGGSPCPPNSRLADCEVASAASVVVPGAHAMSACVPNPNLHARLRLLASSTWPNIAQGHGDFQLYLEISIHNLAPSCQAWRLSFSNKFMQPARDWAQSASIHMPPNSLEKESIISRAWRISSRSIRSAALHCIGQDPFGKVVLCVAPGCQAFGISGSTKNKQTLAGMLGWACWLGPGAWIAGSEVPPGPTPRLPLLHAEPHARHGRV